MKYDPALAYRALSWLRSQFSQSIMAAEWENLLNLVGAICMLHKRMH